MLREESTLQKDVIRNDKGITLPFALILTFIFSALVGVSYLFVSINLSQMQSNLWSAQAISLAEGINEKIKARLNTKNKIQPSPEQEEKLKSPEEEATDEEGGDEEDTLAEEEFNEETEDFDEYYADEILKISRYITFREPPEQTESSQTKSETTESTEKTESSGQAEPGTQAESNALRPEANVEKIGSIDVPRGTVLNKGTMIVVYKDEKINLKLKDIVPEEQGKLPKLPVPIIKSLSPNYCEINKRSSFVVLGENLARNEPRFNNKNIYIEDVKSGPTIKILVSMDVKAGLTHFYFGSAQAEFYVIPPYDGSPAPIISEIKGTDENQLFQIKAGQKHVTIMIYGTDLYLKKSTPVVIPDVVGIIPKIKDQSNSGRDITLTIDIDKKVEPSVHSLVVATEGGLSNSWLFNVLPPDETQQDLSSNTATVSSGLTLLDIRVIENLIPLIDEKEAEQAAKEKKEAKKAKEKTKEKNLPEEDIGEGPTEGEKLSPFQNVDLETSWLLETTCMVGKITKNISEVIHRQIPNVNSALITNGSITFNGGSYQVVGATNAMTTLREPTYISNTVLKVVGPPEEPEEPIVTPSEGRGAEEKNIPKSPAELGFTPGSLVTVFRAGERIGDLDYAIISMVGRDTIELFPPGLMDFHYEGDGVFQFIPPVVSREKMYEEDKEKHTAPKELSITIPNYANPINIFRSNLDQFAELADLYTNDTNVPKDEFDLATGYMGLTYLDATPAYDGSNPLTGKGVLIIDTRADNQGKPTGDVEISGDSKSQADFTGVIYVHGNLKITGNVNIMGALIVDNESRGGVEIDENAIGTISYDPRAIKQTILNTPFTTKPGTIMISNKPINLEGYVQSGAQIAANLGASTNVGQVETPRRGVSTPELPPEEALVETEKRPSVGTIETRPPGSKPAEEELIELF